MNTSGIVFEVLQCYSNSLTRHRRYLLKLAGTRGLRPQIDLHLPQKMRQSSSSTLLNPSTYYIYLLTCSINGCSSTRDTGVTQYWDIIAYLSRFLTPLEDRILRA